MSDLSLNQDEISSLQSENKELKAKMAELEQNNRNFEYKFLAIEQFMQELAAKKDE